MSDTRKLASFFETRKRIALRAFYATMTDDAPEWLRDAVREAHAGMSPNDWVYDECRAALVAFDNGYLTPGDSDSMHEYVDSRVDVYTKALYQWQADMCLSDLFSNAEGMVEDLGSAATGEGRVMAIQYHAIESIVSTILAAVEKHTEDEESEPSEITR